MSAAQQVLSDEQIDTGPEVLRQVFALCEATEDAELSVTSADSQAAQDFMRGRKFEAKQIRRAIGTWFQDEFCGRSFMGEPAALPPVQSMPAPNPFAKRCYTMSESHLSGYRLIVGFTNLDDAQEAHTFVANSARAIESATLKAVSGQEAAPFNGWYCAHCKCAVDPIDVTYHEQHTACGRVITHDAPPAQPAPADEREAFEVWWSAEGVGTDSPYDIAFSAWQARAAPQGAQAPQAKGDEA